MKHIFIAFLLFVAASPSLATGQSRVEKSTLVSPSVKYRAVVDENEAVFTFPLNPKQRYEWCPGGLKYAWFVKINANNQDFELGYFMFTAMGASPCGEGNIHKLLKDGQFGLFRQINESGALITGVTQEGFANYEGNYSDDFLVEKIVVSGFATRNKLTIKLTGAKTIRLLFAKQPKRIIFTSQILENKKSVTVPTTYAARYLSAKSGSPQSRVAGNKPSACLTNDEAKELINDLLPDDSIRYRLDDALTYKPIDSVADIKQGFPVAYLFYQKGYFKLEEGGYIFQFITPKGQNLNAQYPDGFPLATKTLVSVNKVSCVGKRLRVEVTYQINPTQTALEILGDDVYQIKPFNQPWKVGIEFVSGNGKWHLRENLYLSPNID